MAVFVGGIIALVLGIIGLIVWWGPFLNLLAGGIPLALIMGGVLAAYLGYDEVKESMPFKKEEGAAEPLTVSTPGEAEKYREEAERLKEEVERLKKEVEEKEEE